MAVVVEYVLEELVSGEVEHLERYVHAELRGVAAIEGSYSLVSAHCSDAVEGISVRGAIHLQPLLHN